MTSERHIYAHVQLANSLEVVPVGLLTLRTLATGECVGRFGYGARYLQRKDAAALDPVQLPLASGVREITTLKGIPGALRDASPDAWGRRVIARALMRSDSDLDEADYLLHGPQDGAGNLSFTDTLTAPQPNAPYNKTLQLESLIALAQMIEDDSPILTTLPSIPQVLQPGTSLGGARPKATIEDAKKLWLGKFPSKGDRFNIQRVEYATLALARHCGVEVAHARLETMASADVLMLERFDRVRVDEDANKGMGTGYFRLGMVSGLTVLGCEDTHHAREHWSYPLLAQNLRRWSSHPAQDGAELFRRMVFNAMVTNNDDHPRNHALIKSAAGWRLSPAYDLVPTRLISQERRDLALTVGHYGRAASISNLVSSAGSFGLSDSDARDVIARMVDAAQTWRTVFHSSGVSPKDIEHIAPAMLPACFFV